MVRERGSGAGTQSLSLGPAADGLTLVRLSEFSCALRMGMAPRTLCCSGPYLTGEETQAGANPAV